MSTAQTFQAQLRALIERHRAWRRPLTAETIVSILENEANSLRIEVNADPRRPRPATPTPTPTPKVRKKV